MDVNFKKEVKEAKLVCILDSSIESIEDATDVLVRLVVGE
jgi:hypothetical protein